MMKQTLKSIVLAVAGVVALTGNASAAGGGHHYEWQRQPWTFSGFFGTYDREQLQRGFQIYQQGCAACHGLSRVKWRNLVEKGGPEFPEAAVKKLAAEWPNQPLTTNDEGQTVDKKGNLLTRTATLADPILGPYRNEKEARAAQNGALPPDLSLIAKARSIHETPIWYVHVGKMAGEIGRTYQEGGSDYIYNLLMAYAEPPKDVKMSDGMYYNMAYSGNQIAMPPPLNKDSPIAYENGKGTMEENARDVAAFLTWSADPKLNERKATGWYVMLYLLITTVLLYLGKKVVWSRVKH
ncbi:MAG: cytochrome c1 [Hyphomicrobiaceae bacterium]|nr:cytochrome c1 [Hyphomicrobiaceae bacterium]